MSEAKELLEDLQRVKSGGRLGANTEVAVARFLGVSLDEIPDYEFEQHFNIGFCIKEILKRYPEHDLAFVFRPSATHIMLIPGGDWDRSVSTSAPNSEAALLSAIIEMETNAGGN